MATTYGVDGERGARAPAVPPHVKPRRQQAVLLLGILTASVSYSAGLSPPPGWVLLDNGDSTFTNSTFTNGFHWQYEVFFYSNAAVFLASLAVIILHDLPANRISSNQRIEWETPQKCPELLPSKKKNLLKMEQKDHQHQNIVSGQGSADGDQIPKRSRNHLLLVGAILSVPLGVLSLIEAYDAMIVGCVSLYLYLVIHIVVCQSQVYLAWTPWRQALREKMEHCSSGWLKKLFGLSIDELAEEEEEEEEEAVIMGEKLEKMRKLLVHLAVFAEIPAYHASASPQPENLASHRRLAFQCCKASVFIASLSIIAILADMKIPETRRIRWHALRVCLMLEVIGLMGVFVTSGYRKISTMDVLVLVLAVLFCITFHVTGTARGPVQRSPQLLDGADPFPEEGDGSEDELEFGIAGGTNEEPLGLEISSPILGGALSLILAVPVMVILANPVKLLVAIMIASIGVSIWRRSFAKLLRALARALQRRCAVNLQGTTATPPTGSSSRASSTHREQLISAICKVIHKLCLGTWVWILIVVFWVPSLRPNLKINLKMSKITTVLGVVSASAPTMATAATDTPDTPAEVTGTSTTTTMDTPRTATSSTVTVTPTTAATNASSTTSLGNRREDDGPPVVPRPRRNRRPNSRLIGEDWVN